MQHTNEPIQVKLSHSIVKACTVTCNYEYRGLRVTCIASADGDVTAELN